MKLTYKAIARMAGYRIELYANMRNYHWVEYDNSNDIINSSYNIFDTEQYAWKACCIDNGLIEEE